MQADFEDAADDAAELLVTQRIRAKAARAAAKAASFPAVSNVDVETRPREARLISTTVADARRDLQSCKPAEPSDF
jgi:hypothetical protein